MTKSLRARRNYAVAEQAARLSAFIWDNDTVSRSAFRVYAPSDLRGARRGARPVVLNQRKSFVAERN